jgi:hypothetical protein
MQGVEEERAILEFMVHAITGFIWAVMFWRHLSPSAFPPPNIFILSRRQLSFVRGLGICSFDLSWLRPFLFNCLILIICSRCVPLGEIFR